jgi:hypothetical protein
MLGIGVAVVGGGGGLLLALRPDRAEVRARPLP